MQIHQDVQTSNLEGVLHQLEMGESIEARDPGDNRTPLMVAVASDQASVNMVRLLLEQGADVNAVDESGNNTVLALAIRGGALDKVALLLDAGADIAYQKEAGYNALMDAMYSQAMAQGEPLLPLVELLIARGAPVQGESDYGESALSVSSHVGRFDVVRALLEAGADVELLEWDELMQAIALGSLEDVERLLDQSVDLETRDGWHRTPWLLSLQCGDLDKARLLLAKGAKLSERGHCGQTSLMYAIESAQLETLSWLIELGVDLNEKDDFGQTALMKAAQQGATECVRLLLQGGARADLTDTVDKALTTPEESQSRFAEIFTNLNSELMGYFDENELAGLEEQFLEDLDELEGEKAIAKAINLDIVRLLVEAGEDLNEISDEMRAELTGLETEGELECSGHDYERGKRRRFGTTNPEKMDIAFWKAMVRSGVPAWRARETFGDTGFAVEQEPIGADGDAVHKEEESRVETGPVWCFHRFGKSISELPDGRIVEIGGEHEDYYDPDFCIYNEVFVHHGGGNFEIWGYPLDVFAPTDFHSATLVGEFIYIIGCLGYPEARISGETPVYRLRCDSWKIERVETSGDKPGWINSHKARYISLDSGAGEIHISGGKVCALVEGEEAYLDNKDTFVLDLATMVWHRLEP